MSVALRQSVSTFCYTLLDEEKLGKIVEEHSAVGLSKRELLEQQLQEGDYIPVLTAVWSEQDVQKRVEWLRQCAPKAHAPLLYELALAEFKAAPVSKTVDQLVLPLLKTARFRLEQDLRCSRWLVASHPDLGRNWDNVYLLHLDVEVTRSLSTSLQTLFKSNEEIRKIRCTEAVRVVALQSLQGSLPSPDWIKAEGSCLLYEQSEMHPESEYKSRRDTFAGLILEKLPPV